MARTEEKISMQERIVLGESEAKSEAAKFKQDPADYVLSAGLVLAFGVVTIVVVVPVFVFVLQVLVPR